MLADQRIKQKQKKTTQLKEFDASISKTYLIIVEINLVSLSPCDLK